MCSQLYVDCGFARVAIYELSNQGERGNAAPTVNREERAKEFQSLYSTVANFGINCSYFSQHGYCQSRFDKHCKIVLEKFKKRWHPTDSRKSYLDHFSTSQWKALSQWQKVKHTISNCKECADKHQEHQLYFPSTASKISKLTALPKLKKQVSTPSLPQSMKRQTTRKVLTELNSTYEKKFGCSFTECIPSDCPEEGLERKRTCNEKRNEKCKVIRQCKNHLEHQCHEQDATTVLEEGLSLRKYHNLRLAQSFETPPQTQKRSQRSNPMRKSLSPNFSKAAWDKAGLVEEAKTLGTQKANWKALGEKHGITGGNAGQIAKEFLQSQRIDTSTMDQHSGGMRLRARKLRMPGGEISVPCHSTPKRVKEDWVKMIEDGTYSLGSSVHQNSSQL